VPATLLPSRQDSASGTSASTTSEPVLALATP
jgi:hypothetical protein